MRMKGIFLILPLLVLLTGCSNNIGESTAITNDGGCREMGNETPKINDEGDIELEEPVVFDLENTINVLQEALQEEVYEELIIRPMRQAGVRGAIKAEWIEREWFSPVLEVTSEDNRIYRFHIRQNPITHWHTVIAIQDMQTEEFIYTEEGHSPPNPDIVFGS